jgi:hypothetical protein
MTMNCNISLHRSKHPRVDFLVAPWANTAQPVTYSQTKKDQTKQQAYISFEHNATQ